jgi:hypothetical protein
VVDRGLKFFAWFDPTSIEVKSSKVAPAVSIHDTVDVQHWNQLEHKIVSQNFGVQRRSCQVIHDSFHHPACACLTRMDS